MTVRSRRVLGSTVAMLSLALAACSSSTAGSGTGSPPSTPVAATPPTTAPATTPPSTGPAATAPSTPASTAPSGTAGGDATTQTVLRPVTAAGTAATGWTVRTSTQPITCSPAEPSPVAVTPGIAYCGPSAAFAIACWRADAGHALCAVDSQHVLTRYPVSGTFAVPSAPPDAPAPFTMTLADGASCTIRDGGTGTRLTIHPDWVQYYFCTDGAGHTTAVFAPPNGTGVSASSPLWTVDVAADDGSGDITAVPVQTATFVGNADG